MNSLKRLNWGVMGTGWVAQRFMADLPLVNGAVPAAVASRSEERAQQTARRFGMLRAHGSYEALVRDPDVDVVYVATEHHEHAEHCIMALLNGKHVLCEKPFTLSSADAARVIQTAKDCNLFCMEAMWTRFLPSIIAVKQYIATGRIGVPTLLMVDFGAPVANDTNSRFFDRGRGGGALLDRGVYGVSLAVSLFGKPESVQGQARLHASGVDNSQAAILRFKDERIAQVSSSIESYSSNEAVISGTGGRIRLHEPFYCARMVTVVKAPTSGGGRQSDLRPGSFKQRLRNAVSRARPYFPTAALRSNTLRFPVKGFGYSYEAAEVARCITEGINESPTMPLSETLIVTEILEQLGTQFG